MDLESFTLPLLASTIITAYLSYKSNHSGDKENQYDYTQLAIVFMVTFGVVYGFTRMVMDTNDDLQMMNNIKSGDPPF